MAISYPLALPTNIGMASIELRAKNTVAVSMSPFTYKQQTQSYDGEMWEADISLPPMNRDDAETWISFLMSLKGMSGTFLLNDPSAKTVRGTATSAVITGAAGLLGIAHSKALLSVGASVVLTDINLEHLKTAVNSLIQDFDASKIHLYAMDVTSEKSVESVNKSIKKNVLKRVRIFDFMKYYLSRLSELIKRL